MNYTKDNLEGVCFTVGKGTYICKCTLKENGKILIYNPYLPIGKNNGGTHDLDSVLGYLNAGTWWIPCKSPNLTPEIY